MIELPMDSLEMKKTNTCPKCKSTEVTKLPVSKYNNTNFIQLSDWGIYHGYFDRFVCLKCGFLEHYANIDQPGWQKWIDKMREENKLDSDFV